MCLVMNNKQLETLMEWSWKRSMKHRRAHGWIYLCQHQQSNNKIISRVYDRDEVREDNFHSNYRFNSTISFLLA